MTPAARIQAAAEILDRIVAGAAAEQALTGWARASRFAGSKDRAAVRDHVFGAIRRWRSVAALGGGETGRARMIGALRADDIDPETLFTGEGHAPAPLDDAERAAGHTPEGAVALDLPDWLMPQWQAALGPKADSVAEILRHRAPVFLRVNLRKTDMAGAIAALAKDGVMARPHPLANTALEVVENPRRVQQSDAYATGLVELQDAASQALVAALPLPDAGRILDYCAGGGGKTLALGALSDAALFAHDAAPNRMKDLPARAARAGLSVTTLDHAALVRRAPFDLVLCDAPCSGSGAWRRAPEGKWRLTQQMLNEVTTLQGQILRDAARLVAPTGVLAYATCSVLDCENQTQVTQFLQDHPDWELINAAVLTPDFGGDGFYHASFRKIAG